MNGAKYMQTAADFRLKNAAHKIMAMPIMRGLDLSIEEQDGGIYVSCTNSYCLWRAFEQASLEIDPSIDIAGDGDGYVLKLPTASVPPLENDVHLQGHFDLASEMEELNKLPEDGAEDEAETVKPNKAKKSSNK